MISLVNYLSDLKIRELSIDMKIKQTMGLFAEPVSRYTVWAASWQDLLNQQPVQKQSNHSYSTDTQVLDTYPQLKQTMQDLVNDFALTVLGIQEPLTITQSWINIYSPGDSIHQHNHPNSIVSGTWYWHTEPTEILFHKHGLNTATNWTMKLDQQVTDDRPFAVKTNCIRVEENDLLLWPSYLQHSVTEHRGLNPRKSLSFNAMPRTWGSDLHRVIY